MRARAEYRITIVCYVRNSVKAPFDPTAVATNGSLFAVVNSRAYSDLIGLMVLSEVGGTAAQKRRGLVPQKGPLRGHLSSGASALSVII